MRMIEYKSRLYFRIYRMCIIEWAAWIADVHGSEWEHLHRMSWRMMLRSKSGTASYKIVNKTTGEVNYVKKGDYLSRKQIRQASTKPDVIWQFSQRLKEMYAEKGEEVEIYVNARVSVNHKDRKQLIDPNVNMAEAKWDYFFHNDWILLHEDED